MPQTNDHASPTRRDVLLGAGAIAGTVALSGPSVNRLDADHARPWAKARPFEFRNQPKRVLKSFHDLSDDEVRTLCLAVGAMRNGAREKPLPLTSPLQWDQFALLHAHHCADDRAVVVGERPDERLFLIGDRGRRAAPGDAAVLAFHDVGRADVAHARRANDNL